MGDTTWRGIDRATWRDRPTISNGRREAVLRDHGRAHTESRDAHGRGRSRRIARRSSSPRTSSTCSASLQSLVATSSQGEDQDDAARTMIAESRPLDGPIRQRPVGRRPHYHHRRRARHVIGVMPPGLEVLGQRPEVYVPFRMNNQAQRGRSIVGIGRMKPGVTRDQAQAELAGVFAELVREQPETNTRMDREPGSASRATRRRCALPQSSCCLRPSVPCCLIACANIGSLMLSRASSRRRELADSLRARRRHHPDPSTTRH